MPSHAERARAGLEWTARVLGLTAVAALLWILTRPASPATPEAFADGDLGAALVRWTLEQPADSIHLTLDVAPDAAQRDWLLALRRSGVGVSWRAPGVPALAIVAEPVAEPRGRSRIAIAAPRGAIVTARDGVGIIDTVQVAAHGASILAAATGAVEASVGMHEAEAPAADSALVRGILVIGAANWESRFVITALEEQGWSVDARLAIAPGVIVRQGPARAPDTASYSAIVALDTTAAADAAAIVRYVRSGGGVLLAGTAARVPALARIAPGRVGNRWQPTVRPAARPASRSSLGYLPIHSGAPTAVTLDSGGGGVAVAAHRVAAGRVVQVGYDETWRLRMTGGDDGPDRHRSWWGGLVSAAAFAPIVSQPPASLAGLGNAAPLASLAAALGRPRSEPYLVADSRTSPAWLEPLLFAVAIASLLAEWASRRMRGAA